MNNQTVAVQIIPRQMGGMLPLISIFLYSLFPNLFNFFKFILYFVLEEEKKMELSLSIIANNIQRRFFHIPIIQKLCGKSSKPDLLFFYSKFHFPFFISKEPYNKCHACRLSRGCYARRKRTEMH